MNDNLNSDNIISDALNGISGRHIRKSELSLLEDVDNGGGKRKSAKWFRIALTAACAAAVCGIGLTAGAAATQGFTKTKGYDNLFKRPTISFSAASSGGCPETIEQFYTLTELPQGINYHRSETLNESKTELRVQYIQELEDMYDDAFLFLKTVEFFQMTKEEFSVTFETPEFVEVSETTVNGCPAFMLNRERYYGSTNYIFWDNGDYILGVYANLPPEETMRLAQSVAADENALRGEGMQ